MDINKPHAGESKERMRRSLMFRTMQQCERAPVEEGWAERASCAPGSGHDPDIFFPEAGSSGVVVARVVCAGCPVRVSCLATALAGGVNCLGVWGGYTDTERRRYRTWRATQTRQAMREREGAA